MNSRHPHDERHPSARTSGAPLENAPFIAGVVLFAIFAWTVRDVRPLSPVLYPAFLIISSGSLMSYAVLRWLVHREPLSMLVCGTLFLVMPLVSAIVESWGLEGTTRIALTAASSLVSGVALILYVRKYRDLYGRAQPA